MQIKIYPANTSFTSSATVFFLIVSAADHPDNFNPKPRIDAQLWVFKFGHSNQPIF